MAFTKSMIIWAKSANTKYSEDEAAGEELSTSTIYYNKVFPPTEEKETSYNMLALDCVLSEGHVFQNHVTSYPISNGFLVSEHVIKRNPRFTINGIVTNVNMADSFSAGSLISTAGKVVGSMVSRAVGPLLGSLIGSAAHAIDNVGITEDAIKEAFLQLQRLVRDGTIVHVATILGAYEGCVLREVSIHQDVRTATILPVSLTFEQMQIIQPDGRIGFILPDDQVQALKTQTPNDTALLLGALKSSGVNIIGSFL